MAITPLYDTILQMEFLKKHVALLVLGAVIAVGSFNLGFNSGEKNLSTAVVDIENLNKNRPANVDFAPFWKAWNLINEKYVPASTTSETVGDQEKVWGAIKGLTSSLGDPYTVFFPPVESELFESDIRGNFEGVGMEVVAKDGAITVIAPLKDSPAAKAGIMAGDRIIKIDSKELPGGIFLIELYSFSAQSPNLFRGALREFILSNNDKLILDLRGNPGGYLEAAIDMASWFLPSSRVVVREDFGRS